MLGLPSSCTQLSNEISVGARHVSSADVGSEEHRRLLLRVRCAVQVTLDDMWSLDLVKLNGWTLVKDNTAGQEEFVDGPAADSESSGDDAERDE